MCPEVREAESRRDRPATRVKPCKWSLLSIGLGWVRLTLQDAAAEARRRLPACRRLDASHTARCLTSHAGR